jgi:hypothetical protein
VSDPPALISPDRKKERIISAAVEIGAFAKQQLPVSFVPSCSQSKKRRKSAPRGHSRGDIPDREIELGLLQSRPDRRAGDRRGSIGTARAHCRAAVVLDAHRGGAVLPLLVKRRPMSLGTRNSAFRALHAFPGRTAVSTDARTRDPDPLGALLNYTITLTTRLSEFMACCC